MTRVDRPGLSGLADVALPVELEARLDAAARTASGPPAWRHRKHAEARDLLALAAIAPRMVVDALDLRGELLALFRIRVPVPCCTGPSAPLEIMPEARIALRYPQEAVRKPMPGTAFLQIREPAGVWHANVARDPVQPLCLGIQMPAGIPVRELVIAAYGALSMQTVQIDERDPAGVLNVAAALWWQQNTDRIPLSSAPFLGRADLAEEGNP